MIPAKRYRQDLFGVRRGEQITRDLFDDKPVKGISLLRRRHPLAGIVTVDTAPQFAAVEIARFNGDCTTVGGPEPSLGRVQTQSCFALLRVEAVACEAFIRKNRANVSIEGERGFVRRGIR
jgi:hypothetical protein